MNPARLFEIGAELVVWLRRHHAQGGAVIMLLAMHNGCGKRPPAILSAPLEVAEKVNLGYIPPEGGQATFSVRNTGGSPIRINGVSSSCGCATVEWPNHVGAGAIATLKVHLKGLHQFAPSGADLTISTTPGGQRRVAITYTTGVLPSFDRSEFRDAEGNPTRGPRCYACTLHVRTDLRGQLVQCTVGIGTPAMIEFDPSQPNGVVLSSDRSAVTVAEPGIYALPLRITNDLAATAPAGFGTDSIRTTISVGADQHVRFVRFIHEGTRRPSLFPDRAVIVYGDENELSGKTRQFMITCEPGQQCELITIDDNLEGELSRVNDRVWTLRVRLRDKMSIPDGKHEIVVSCGESRLKAVLDIRRG